MAAGNVLSALGDINFAGYLSSIMKWAGYGIAIIAIIAVLFFIYYNFSFKVKMVYWELYGSGSGDGLAVGKRKTARFKLNKTKTAWKKMWDFSKKEYEPFPDKFVYQANTVYAFKLGERFIPASLTVTKNEAGALEASVDPVPNYLRNWDAIEARRDTEEFTKQDFWSQNKIWFITIGTVALCCILVGVTVYFTYKYSGLKAADTSRLIDAIRGIGNIPAIPAGG